MAITMNGQTFTTLSDELYLNGKRIVAAHANGTLVYPEGAYLVRVDGGYTYSSSHTHTGDSEGSPFLPCSVSNSLSVSYSGTFMSATPFTSNQWTNSAGIYGSDSHYFDGNPEERLYMEPYGYRFSIRSTPIGLTSCYGTNGSMTVDAMTGGTIGNTVNIVGSMGIDISMSQPTFCGPLRVNKRDGRDYLFGLLSAEVTGDFANGFSGHFDITQNDLSSGGFHNHIMEKSTYLYSSSTDGGTYIQLGVINSGAQCYIGIAVPVTATIEWEYILHSGTVSSYQDVETYNTLYDLSDRLLISGSPIFSNVFAAAATATEVIS